MSYTDKLKDHRWLEKRKRIIERDGYKCVSCGSTRELHVHHIKYYRSPWDVKDESLVTLCKHCHTIEEEYRKKDQLLKQLSSDTNIPCIMLATIFESLVKLKIDQVDLLQGFITLFFDELGNRNKKEKVCIEHKSNEKYHSRLVAVPFREAFEDG